MSFPQHLAAVALQGAQLDFVKAGLSSWRWASDDERRIAALGHRVHTLQDAGHWLHADNPRGLLDILSPSFGGGVVVPRG